METDKWRRLFFPKEINWAEKTAYCEENFEKPRRLAVGYAEAPGSFATSPPFPLSACGEGALRSKGGEVTKEASPWVASVEASRGGEAFNAFNRTNRQLVGKKLSWFYEQRLKLRIKLNLFE